MPFDLQTFAWSVLTAGGGAAVITIGVVKAFGSAWLESRFSERLQALKHAHDQEMAKLKLKIDGQLDRAVKLNQREFDVVPMIWKAVTEAHYSVMGTISTMQSHPNLHRMTDEEFEGFLDGTRLQDFQKVEIRQLNGWDRTSYYADKLRWLQLNDSNKLVIDFNHALLTNSIFLHPDTFAEFEMFSDPLRKGFNRWCVNMQMGDPYHIPPEGQPDPVEDLRRNGTELYEKLAGYLREHFYGLEGVTPSNL